jgi:hypothetical protein
LAKTNYLPYKLILAGLVSILAPGMQYFSKGNLGNSLGPSETIWGIMNTLHFSHNPKSIYS